MSEVLYPFLSDAAMICSRRTTAEMMMIMTENHTGHVHTVGLTHMRARKLRPKKTETTDIRAFYELIAEPGIQGGILLCKGQVAGLLFLCICTNI